MRQKPHAQQMGQIWPCVGHCSRNRVPMAVGEFLLEQLVQCGLQKLPSCLPEVSYSIRNARAFSGLQSNTRILPLVPEYKMICMVTGSFQCNFRPKERLSQPWPVPTTGQAEPALAVIPASTTFRGIQARVLQEPPLEFTGSLRSS